MSKPSGQKCTVCGEPIRSVPGSGRPRKQHVWCGDRKNFEMGLKSIREHFGEDEYEDAAEKCGLLQRMPGVEKPVANNFGSRVERMAIGLSIHPKDPVAAGASAGLLLEVNEAHELAQQAREQHQDLIELRSNAAAKLAQQTLLLLTVGIRDMASDMAPQQLSPALKALQVVLQYFSGGLQSVYNDIELVVNAPDGSKFLWTPNGPVKKESQN